MRRIVILGPAGGGKSTFARRLGKRLAIPVVHLDALCWEPGWKALTVDTFRSRLGKAISGDAWITDGNYAKLTFDLRMPRADLVIWVERSPLQCAWRVCKRAIKSHFSADEDLAYGCKERIDRRFLDRLRYIATFQPRESSTHRSGADDARTACTRARSARRSRDLRVSGEVRKCSSPGWFINSLPMILSFEQNSPEFVDAAGLSCMGV